MVSEPCAIAGWQALGHKAADAALQRLSQGDRARDGPGYRRELTDQFGPLRGTGQFGAHGRQCPPVAGQTFVCALPAQSNAQAMRRNPAIDRVLRPDAGAANGLVVLFQKPRKRGRGQQGRGVDLAIFDARVRDDSLDVRAFIPWLTGGVDGGKGPQ